MQFVFLLVEKAAIHYAQSISNEFTFTLSSFNSTCLVQWDWKTRPDNDDPTFRHHMPRKISDLPSLTELELSLANVEFEFHDCSHIRDQLPIENLTQLKVISTACYSVST
ncbi:hypothetical protein AcV5_002761 [Taiwanofungus camphoratus]|nr:hypothetical protein AcV5_002761 [Antrodia cinnamomea]